MFSEDAHTAVKRKELNSCCKYGGFWDFPKWPDIKIMEVKYIFCGPVLHATITKSLFQISEDDEANHRNKTEQQKYINCKVFCTGHYICS